MTLFVPVNHCLRFRALPHLTITGAQEWVNSREVPLAWTIETMFVEDPIAAPEPVRTELHHLSPETLRECRLVVDRVKSEAHQPLED